MVISVMVGYGYNINAPKRIASFKNNVDTQNLINDIISTRLYLGLIFLFVSLIVVFFFPQFFMNMFLFFHFTIILSEALNPFFYFQGNDKLVGVVLSNFFIKSFYLLFILFLIDSSNDAFLVNLFFGFSSLIVYVFCWIYIYNNQKFSFSFSNQNNFLIE